jgi:hypothetical protein
MKLVALAYWSSVFADKSAEDLWRRKPLREAKLGVNKVYTCSTAELRCMEQVARELADAME